MCLTSWIRKLTIFLCCTIFKLIMFFMPLYYAVLHLIIDEFAIRTFNKLNWALRRRLKFKLCLPYQERVHFPVFDLKIVKIISTDVIVRLNIAKVIKNRESIIFSPNNSQFWFPLILFSSPSFKFQVTRGKPKAQAQFPVETWRTKNVEIL